MIPGLILQPEFMAPPSLLLINTRTVRATDFRNHKVGPAPADWEWNSTYPLSIAEEGIISSKCLKFTANASSYARLRWWLSFDSDEPEQEVLTLMETRTTPSGGNWQAHFGAIVRFNAVANQYVFAAFGRNNSGNRLLTETRGPSNSGSDILTISYSSNTPYWFRLRSQGTSQVRIKWWPFGSSEPSSWNQTYSRSSSNMPNTSGVAGVIVGSYDVNRTHRFHYFAHCIGGGSAPLPPGV